MYSLPRVLSNLGSFNLCLRVSISASMIRSSSDLLLHSPMDLMRLSYSRSSCARTTETGLRELRSTYAPAQNPGHASPV